MRALAGTKRRCAVAYLALIDSALGDKYAGCSDVRSVVLAGCRVGFGSGRWVQKADAIRLDADRGLLFVFAKLLT